MGTNVKLVRFNRLILLLILITIAFSGCGEPDLIEIYVSVEGDDLADGSISNPYSTLPAAVDKVRNLRKSGNTNPATIYLREGRHQLNQTLVLGLEDGASAPDESTPFEEYGAGPLTGPAHLTFAAYPGETPVVSSGIPVTGWKILDSPPSELPAQAAGKVWVADIPEGLEKFYTLYDDRGATEPCKRCRIPNNQSR